MKRIKASLALQISLFLLALVVVCAVLVGVSSYVLYRGDNIDSNAKRALAVAEASAAMIEPDAFVEVMQSGEKNAYWEAAKRALDETKVRTEVKYLYALDANYDDVMTYFAEGYDPVNDLEEEADLGYQEPVVMDGEAVYADEMYETLSTGQPTVTDAYDSGDFGTMVSGFAAIKSSDGHVVGVVGVDISLNEVMAATNAFLLRIVLIILAFCIVAGIFSVWFMNRHIGVPIGALTKASDRMAEGDMDVEFSTGRADEIGRLATSFEAMAKGTSEQITILERLAEGDLTMKVALRSDKDSMGMALGKMLDQLNGLFNEVQLSSHQVALGADQIANGAQILASGATEQAATLQQFSAAISDVLQQSEDNARQAATAYEGTMQVGSLMDESMEAMRSLAASMEEINESSKQIAGVIKVVDDIAFQTNILALNAAVEAARAGQHGKGFAVVADEVRNLAAKSAEAARETAAMIEDSMNKVTAGVEIADKTQITQQAVNEIAATNAQAMEHINLSSEQQNQAIGEITTGIGELSGVVQANSATAEESAAAAEEMSSQAQMLNAIIGRFKLDETKRLPQG